MTDQETGTVIAAVEDALILAIPDTLPVNKRVELVNSCRREVARILKSDPPPPTRRTATR